MQFQSLEYMLLLAVVVPLHWVLPGRARSFLLLLASFFFYCWYKWEYGFLLGFVICNSYCLSKHAAKIKKPWPAYVSIVANVSALCYFKYFIFVLESANSVLGAAGISRRFSTWEIFLPLGISFFTFQAMSYTLDLLKKRVEPIDSLKDFALYLVFWPQLIAGPIMRSGELLPQLRAERRFCADGFKQGVRLVLQGLFLKLVLADRIAPFVDEGFRTHGLNTMLDNWTLCFAFGLQIYFDFAGYSTIALGSARLLGIELTKNFSFPYASPNPKVFWRNWHISLSSWVRDYLYIPLMGVQTARAGSAGGIGEAADLPENAGKMGQRRGTALLGSWAIMGLWHGANWTFVLWGVYHAIVIQVYRWMCAAGKKVRPGGMGGPVRALGFGLTSMAMMASWIFFRAQDSTQAFEMLGKLLDFGSLPKLTYREGNYLNVALFYLGMLLCFWVWKHRDRIMAGRLYVRVGWIVKSLVCAVMAVLVVAYFEVTQQFIYFQF